MVVQLPGARTKVTLDPTILSEALHDVLDPELRPLEQAVDALLDLGRRPRWYVESPAKFGHWDAMLGLFQLITLQERGGDVSFLNPEAS